MPDTKIELTQDRLKELLRYCPRTGNFTRLVTRSGNAKAGSLAGALAVRGGIVIRIDGKDYHAHRLAYLYMTGAFPAAGMEIDHIDRDATDNRWCNLRLATSSQNNHNTGVRKNNTHGYKGVSRVGNRWTARIRLNWKKYYLGCFATPEEAHAAYVKAAKEMHGEFARTA